jgi:2-iminobutanoate/2-iminopropanoate deaminase
VSAAIMMDKFTPAAALVTAAVPAIWLAVRAYRNRKAAVKTTKSPAAIGPYSQAIRANGLLFVSGQIPLDPATGEFCADKSIDGQTMRVLENMKAVLEAAGCSMADVLKTTVLIADMNDFARVNAIYGSYFHSPYPARACYAVKGLPKGALVEIECTAVIP